MSLLRFLPLFLAGLFLSVRVAAQQPPRDPQAVSVLEMSLAAMGGHAAVAQIRDAVARGRFQAMPDSVAKSGVFIWKHMWVGGAFEFRREMELDADSTHRTIVVSGHGNPTASYHGNRIELPEAAALEPAVHLPCRVLLSLLENPEYVVSAPSVTVLDDGRRAIQIHIELVGDPETRVVSAQDWFVDPNTWVVLRLEYRVPLVPDPTSTKPSQETLLIAVDYAQFRAIGSVVVPFTMAVYERGRKVGTVELESVTFNTGLAAVEFESPNIGGDR